MGYKYSQVDRDNIKWMENNNSCNTLVSIHLEFGTIRCLNPFQIDFTYPITAIAGANGSGKSTILALAACAFHNSKDAFRFPDKKVAYYTYSDFFMGIDEENSVEGVTLRYAIRYNRWKRTGEGIGWQTKKKTVGGKWTSYEKRLQRQVAFFGTQRVVPPYERSTHKSYRTYFRSDKAGLTEWNRVAELAGKILGKSYTAVDRWSHSKYILAKASCGEINYSGFNMGAGECTVFEILFFLLSKAGRGALLVIDEIELCLHEQAQRRFIDVLKDICKECYCQIICTTHSHAILDSLPPEGRIFIDSLNSNTAILPGITAEWACGTLAGRNTAELHILVEDEIAELVLVNCLSHEHRKRVNIHPIGSSNAILRVLAGQYALGKNNYIAILDGDKQSSHQSNISTIQKSSECSNDAEKDALKTWATAKLFYLPGNTWPEKYIISKAIAIQDKKELCISFGMQSTYLLEKYLNDAIAAGKHEEFDTLAKNLDLNKSSVINDIVKFVKANTTEFEEIIEKISTTLSHLQ